MPVLGRVGGLPHAVVHVLDEGKVAQTCAAGIEVARSVRAPNAAGYEIEIVR